MFGNENDINLTVKAKDEASTEIKTFSESLAELKQMMDSAAKSADNVTESQKKLAKESDNTGKANKKLAKEQESLAMSVFKGVGGWDMLKTATREAGQFMTESIQAYLEAQKSIDLTRSVVEAMGQKFDDVSPKLKEFGDRMAQMGTDDEDAMLAAAKLAKMMGGDLTQGMQMAKLAADLTSSGYNDFAGNVDNLTRVLSGKGQRALMDYRINLDENATTAQQLDAIQKKVTQTTEQYADTIPGKINIVKIAYQNLKEEVGAGFVIALTNSITAGRGASDTLATLTTVSNVLKISIFELVTFLNVVVQSLIITGKATKGVVESFIALKAAASGEIKTGLEIGKKAMDSFSYSTASFDAAMTDLLNPLDALARGEKALSEQTTKNSQKTKEDAEAWAKSLSKIINANINTGNSTEKLSGKYKTLGETIAKLRQSASDELNSLTKTHNESVEQSLSRISDLRKSLSDLSYSYNKTASDAAKAFQQQKEQDAANIGESIVAQQKKIAELRKQAGYETDPQKRILLEQELKKEEEAYASQSEFIKTMSAEVTEAKRRDALTEFERLIEDYKQKRILAEQEYAENRADAIREFSARQSEILAEINQEQKKMEAETAAYKKSQSEITKALETANSMRLDTTQKTASQIIALVDAQIDRYNRLADAIARASQGKSPAIAQIPYAPITREFGGIVPGPVGTAVPIIAHGQERVIPASQAGGSNGGTYSIIINNPVVRNDADLNAVRQMIEDALRDVSRVHKLTSI